MRRDRPQLLLDFAVTSQEELQLGAARARNGVAWEPGCDPDWCGELGEDTAGKAQNALSSDMGAASTNLRWISKEPFAVVSNIVVLICTVI